MVIYHHRLGALGLGAHQASLLGPLGLGFLLPLQVWFLPGPLLWRQRQGQNEGRGGMESPDPSATLGLGPHPSGGPQAGGRSCRGWLFKN